MGLVYRVENEHGLVYVNTAKEANRCKPGDIEPTAVEFLDAAEECTRLYETIEKREALVGRTIALLRDLFDDCRAGEDITDDVRKRIWEFLKAHPEEPATAADRDGGRSYGV